MGTRDVLKMLQHFLAGAILHETKKSKVFIHCEVNYLNFNLLVGIDEVGSDFALLHFRIQPCLEVLFGFRAHGMSRFEGL